MAIFKKKQVPDSDIPDFNERDASAEHSKKESTPQKGLPPIQKVPEDLIPLDENGNKLPIIDRTQITWQDTSSTVDVYSDGTIILPDNETVARLDSGDFARILAQYKAQQEQAARTAQRRNAAKQKSRGSASSPASSVAQDMLDFKNNRSKRIIAAIIYIVMLVIILAFAKGVLNNQQRQVNVVRLSSDMLAGDVLTEENIESYTMLESAYNTLGKVTYTQDGKEVTQQIMVLWQDRAELVGKYMTQYTQSGQYLTKRHVTETSITRNPWLAEVEEGEEIYTLPFDTAGVDIKLLYPGSHMRVRLIIQMDADDSGNADGSTIDSTTEDQLAAANSAMTQAEILSRAAEEAGAEATINEQLSESYHNARDAQNDENTSQAERDAAVNQFLSDVAFVNAARIPIVEIVFDELVAVDMLNAANESIYDIYMALLKLPLDERADYLQTTIEENSAQKFQTRVTPKALVFVLNPEEATAMAQFENLTNSTFKYTILPYADEDNNMISSFIQIADQLQTVLDNAANAS